jgi:hypothetical protein
MMVVVMIVRMVAMIVKMKRVHVAAMTLVNNERK